MQETLKNEIENCLLCLDFETQRMSFGGEQEYRKLRNIVIDLYNNNIELKKKIEIYELKKNKNKKEIK